MVLFLPSMIGNATQNYIIVLLFIALFSNPVSNISMNALESVRVIGCSLTMTFEQLKERAKLILNPIIEVLSDTERTDLQPIQEDLMKIRQIVLDIRREAEFNRNLSDKSDLESVPFSEQLPMPPPSTQDIVSDLKERLKTTDLDVTQEIANKTRELIADSTLELDRGKLGVRASLDVRELKRLMKVNMSGPLGEFNLTEIMHENCLGIFRRAKMECQAAVADMLGNCFNVLGIFQASIWCSPTRLTLNRICPWLVNQLVDENNLCNQMRNASTKIRFDPFGITGGGNINDVYKNLTKQVLSLGDDIIDNGGSTQTIPKRLELSITFNNQTRNLFSQASNLIDFITDKYRMRRFFYDLSLFIYEVYTTITFVCILIQAYHYQRNYLKQIRFDNHYITDQFIALDRRRRAMGKPSILPLTKDESDRYITAFTCKRRTSEERHTQKANCTMSVLFLAFSLGLLYFDNIFYSILSSVHEHALVKFSEIGHHELDVRVLGEGAIARLVRKLTARLNSVYDLNRLTSTKECLPIARQTSNRFYLEFCYLVFIYLSIDQISVYAMRFRRITSAFFYPEKERRRIMFLYSLMLVQRRRLIETGFQGYIGNDDDDLRHDLDKDELNTYTARDALSYLGNCISDSLLCCGFPMLKESPPAKPTTTSGYTRI